MSIYVKVNSIIPCIPYHPSSYRSRYQFPEQDERMDSSPVHSHFTSKFNWIHSWAAHRGHQNVTSYLLSKGARSSIETKKGETAIDLAKGGARQCFGLAPETPGTELKTPLSFIPNYLKNPDLMKTWDVPDKKNGIKTPIDTFVETAVEPSRANIYPPKAPIQCIIIKNHFFI